MIKRRFSPRLLAALSSIVIVLGSGTVIFHRLEDWTWLQSFYFTVVTTTTVGYGDLVPTNDTSRLVASIFILFGVGVLITAVGFVGGFFMSRREDKYSGRKRSRK